MAYSRKRDKVASAFNPYAVNVTVKAASINNLDEVGERAARYSISFGEARAQLYRIEREKAYGRR